VLTISRITIGSSDHGRRSVGEPRRESMIGINQLRLAALLLVLSCGVTTAGEWKTIKPGATSEAELIEAFGPPDEVISTFPWMEWNAKWTKRPKADHYTLRYSRYSGKAAISELLTGPGGPAEEADVLVYQGRVRGVEWHYGGPLAHDAALALRSDKKMTVDRTHDVSRASVQTDYGVLIVEFGPEDTRVDVSLGLK
jgi:hypothetical protein